MLAHWYGLLFSERSPEETAKAHGKERGKTPRKSAYEVDSFSGWPNKTHKNDDEECLILLMM